MVTLSLLAAAGIALAQEPAQSPIEVPMDLQGHPTMHLTWRFFGKGLIGALLHQVALQARRKVIEQLDESRLVPVCRHFDNEIGKILHLRQRQSIPLPIHLLYQVRHNSKGGSSRSATLLPRLTAKRLGWCTHRKTENTIVGLQPFRNPL